LLGKSDIRALISEIEWTQKICAQLVAGIDDKVTTVTEGDYAYVYLEALAVNLMHFYAAVESVFDKIARKIDESVPQGGSSHLELLKRMLVEIEGVRCAVLSKETYDLIDKFRSFRDKSYHDFSITYRWEEMKDLCFSAKKALILFNRDIGNFKTFLRNMIA